MISYRKYRISVIFLSKVTAALKLLSTDAKGVLPLNSKIPCGQNGVDAVRKSVREILVEKHPPGRAAVSDTLLESDGADAPCYDPVLFEQLTGDLIRWAALHTHGAAGPSGVDAYAWRRLCSSFGSASVTLCNSLAAVARRLCVDDAWCSTYWSWQCSSKDNCKSCPSCD